MSSPTYFEAVLALVGGEMGGPSNGPVSEISFHSSQTPPTEEAIQAKLKELQDTYDAEQYQRDRRLEFPNMGDQLDALYHAGVFPKEMSDKLKAVKEAHPKPE